MFFNDENKIVLQSGPVELLPYKPCPIIPRQMLTDAELMASVGQTLFMDCEVYPNYFCCGFKLHRSNKYLTIECGQDRSFNPMFLSWLLQSFRTVGFNSIKYDILITWLAHATQDTYKIKDASNDLIIGGMRKKELKAKYHFLTHSIDHIDLIEVAPLKGSLKLYGARLHVPRIQDLPFPDDTELTEDEIEIVKHYNYNDLDITEALFDFMKERIELRESMGQEYNEDLRSKSDAQIAEVVLAKEVTKINGKRPENYKIPEGTIFKYSIPQYIKYENPILQNFLAKIRKAKFIVGPTGKIAIPDELTGAIPIGKGEYRIGIGGLHSSEKTVSYIATETKAIVDRDFTSFYPRIITTLKLCPASMGTAFLIVYETIIQSRIEAKRAKNFTADKGKKIVINGTSGKFSDIWSTLYSPDLTIQMTVTGQLILLMFIETLESNGLEVISANTDGIVTLVHKDQEEIFTQCIQYIEGLTNIQTEETRYSRYHSRDVNNYFAIKTDAKSTKDVKVKGAYSEVGSQSGTQLDTNPVALVCSDAIKQLLLDETPIEQTIRACKDFTRFVIVRNAKSPGAHKNREYLGKVIRWYWAKNESGAINTVAHNNKVADSDGGKPVMDLPSTFPEDIDYEKYIAEATEMLYDIGYLKRAKQLAFF